MIVNGDEKQIYQKGNTKYICPNIDFTILSVSEYTSAYLCVSNWLFNIFICNLRISIYIIITKIYNYLILFKILWIFLVIFLKSRFKLNRILTN